MTPLETYLRRRIALDGPITVASFIADALTHPKYGYYISRDPLGSGGDFTTAPEISQTFGELIGLWFAELWQRFDRPNPVQLVELGPGRGTLMADLLRAAKLLPGFIDAVSIHLVEASPVLRVRQQESLSGHAIRWHDTLDTVPAGPTLLVANEFFDALPIHQLVLTQSGWHERLVTVTDDAALSFGLSPGRSPLESLIPEPIRSTAQLGSVFEVSPASFAVTRGIAERIRENGAALIIDYGHPESAVGETLQAVRKHKFEAVLDNPGAQDITAHVDFAALSRVATESGNLVFGPLNQGDLLRQLGIEFRRQQLTQTAAEDQKRHINSAIDRLIAPDQMGTLFKAISILPNGAGVPPGFEELL